jgi:hypothetical protein
MANQHVYSHHNNAAEYQTSSIPFVKTLSIADGDLTRVSFPFITRFIVINTDQDLKLLFSATGEATDNYFVVATGTSPRLEIKCREFWIKNDSGGAAIASVLAGLTNIPYSQFPNLAGIPGIG